MSAPPIALTIAGFDTSAGAGLQADLLTFHNHCYQPLTIATTLVAETPLTVAGLSPVPPDFFEQQLSVLLETYRPTTIKIGLLAHPAQASLLVRHLVPLSCPIVLDPVGIASTGHHLQHPDTPAAILEQLAPLLTVLTPNLPEARALLGDSTIPPEDAALALSHKVDTAILLSGGHHPANNQVTDLLAIDGTLHSFPTPFIPTPASLHGTGCVLSSALAAQLGKGQSLPRAIPHAQAYLQSALKNFHQFEHPVPLLGLNHHAAEATTNG